MTNTELYLYAKAKNGSGGGSSDAEQMLKGIIDKTITRCNIPYGTTQIGEYVFQFCYDLESVTIPNSVTIIVEGAFDNCESLTSVTIPNSVTIIGAGAFLGCRSLTSVEIPNSIEMTEYDTFYGCINLTNVTIETNFNAPLNISASTKFSVETLVAILNNLADRTGLEVYPLVIGNTNLAKLSSEQIAIATEKNWTLA